MIEVERLFGPHGLYVTELWVSKEVIEQIKSEQNAGQCLSKLESYCKAGLHRFQGAKNRPVRLEHGKTFRIKLNGTFRIAAFYDGNCCIAIKAFTKSKQKSTSKEREIYKNVDSIRASKTWRKI